MKYYNVDNIVINIVTILYYNINTYIVTSKGQSIIIYCNITVYEYNTNMDIVTGNFNRVFKLYNVQLTQGVRLQNCMESDGGPMY